MKCQDDVITSVNGVPFPAYDKDKCNSALAYSILLNFRSYNYDCSCCDYNQLDVYAHLVGALSCLEASEAKPFLDALLQTFPDENARLSESTLQINFQSTEAEPIPDTEFQVGDLIYEGCQQIHGFIVADPSEFDPGKGASLVVQVAAEEVLGWQDHTYTPYIYVAPELPKYMYVSSKDSTLVHRNA